MSFGASAWPIRGDDLTLGRGERKQRAVVHSCMLHLVGEEGFVLTPGHFQLGLGLCFFVGAATPSRLQVCCYGFLVYRAYVLWLFSRVCYSFFGFCQGFVGFIGLRVVCNMVFVLFSIWATWLSQPPRTQVWCDK